MTTRIQMFVVAAALAIVGCSNTGTPSSSPSSFPSVSSSPTVQATSAFCLDLTTFQIGVSLFRDEVGDAIDGQRLDLAELRRKAKIIARYAREMKASVPPDIAAQFETVVSAVAASMKRLTPGGSLRGVADPLFRASNQAAFDAVNIYRCP